MRVIKHNKKIIKRKNFTVEYIADSLTQRQLDALTESTIAAKLLDNKTLYLEFKHIESFQTLHLIDELTSESEILITLYILSNKNKVVESYTLSAITPITYTEMSSIDKNNMITYVRYAVKSHRSQHENVARMVKYMVDQLR